MIVPIANLPTIRREVRIDSVNAGIETKIIVLALDDGSEQCFAQVYRRRDSTGDWGVPVHTTLTMPTWLHALTAGRLWHRAHPAVMSEQPA